MAKRGRFIERFLMSAVSFLQGSVFADEVASRKGFLQAREPRAKTLAILSLLLSVLFAKSPAFIACLYFVCLLLARVSSIGLVFFLKRSWVFIPLFSLCIAFPALFSMFTPGVALVSFKVFAFTLVITKEGAWSAGIFFLRVLVSVSLCVLLALTTRQYVLLKVLRIFKVPQVFVMTLGMCVRYVYLLIEIVLDTYRAVKSRTGGVSSPQGGRRLVAWNIASLWQRSYQFYDQVYHAMLSRGYDGEVRVMEEPSIRGLDVLWLLLAVFVFAGSLWQTYCLN